MKKYIKTPKNAYLFILFIGLIILAVSACLAAIFEFGNTIGLIISGSICAIILCILGVLIILGKISLVKIDAEGILIKENKRKYLILWSELIDIKTNVLISSMIGRNPMCKFTLMTSKKDFYVHNGREFLDILIGYCTSADFLEKLKKIRAT